MAKLARREFLQLAETYAEKKHKMGGKYVSEKLDGTRCFWDGGLTRGIPTKQIPWANVIDPKTGLIKSKVKPTATGLWSRYGNPIIAPDWWLDSLPQIPLDGELWAGRGKFQLCRSICGGDDPDPRFDQIQYAIYSSPSLHNVLKDGEIKNANFTAIFDWEKTKRFLARIIDEPGRKFRHTDPEATFEDELAFLNERVKYGPTIFVHRQHPLDDDEGLAGGVVNAFLNDVLDKGGEGCVLRDPKAVWTPKRHNGILKFKPYEDAEAKIIGYRAGKEGRIGQALGKIGTLCVETISLEHNCRFEIGSGLTLQQREFFFEDDAAFARKHPGELMPAETLGKYLKLGETITFKYRELTDDGIPKEGRFWRVRDAE